MRTILGIIILLIGLQLLLSATGVKNVPSFDDWWPAILVVIGLMSWRNNPRMIFWPLILICLGFVFLMANYGVLPGNAWDYVWPAVIIFLGLHVLTGKKWESWGTKSNTGSGQNVFAAFSGRDEKVVGEFSKGSTSAWFGGTKIDLRTATIAHDAEMEVYAAFGGIEILVPKGVNVRLKVMPIFGGSEDKTEHDSSLTKTLTVSGTAMFGGVEVKN